MHVENPFGFMMNKQIPLTGDNSTSQSMQIIAPMPPHSSTALYTILSDVCDSAKGSCKPPTKANALVRKLACIAD